MLYWTSVLKKVNTWDLKVARQKHQGSSAGFMKNHVPAHSSVLRSSEKTLLTEACSRTPVSGGSFVSARSKGADNGSKDKRSRMKRGCE